MFAVEVRDHVMIAHSLPRPVFGPAQGLHGATYVVDAAFFTTGVDEDGLGIDIGLAMAELGRALKPLAYANLDTLPQFAGKVTTTEVVAKYVFDRLAAAEHEGRLGTPGRIARIRVTLEESHLAKAWYEAELSTPR